MRLSRDAKYMILRVDCELSREIHICISEITINIMKWTLLDWIRLMCKWNEIEELKCKRRNLSLNCVKLNMAF